MSLEKILIMDFGSQYTQLITRRIRELGVFSEILPHDCGYERVLEFNPVGIILSGGPLSVVGDEYPNVAQEIFEMNIPILGVCYGMQLMALKLGGDVAQGQVREFGHAQIRARGHSVLLDKIQDRTNKDGHGLLDVWMSHGDSVTRLPTGFKIIASNENNPIAGMANEEKKYYGLQFHPEVTHTKKGKDILDSFISKICGIEKQWSISNLVPDRIQQIRETVGREKVILGLSGGVDSSVAATLMSKAIGEQLICVFVDNGLLRLNEATEVMETFSSNLNVNVVHVDGKKEFMTALSGVTEPERKRKIIGREFINIFEREAKRIRNVSWLGQGTIYPDVIESAGGSNQKAMNIKSHHNVGGLPSRLNLKLIEPLRDLFKDEVRKLGTELGLPKKLLYRHPFPGPGLGVRILGEVKLEYAEILRKADFIFIDELDKEGWYPRVSQAFAVFLPVRSVGVMGDGRTYDYVVALRAVETSDFMTATWAKLPNDLLSKISNRIINEVNGVNRVVYDISSKPPATIEWE